MLLDKLAGGVEGRGDVVEGVDDKWWQRSTMKVIFNTINFQYISTIWLIDACTYNLMVCIVFYYLNVKLV